MLVPWNIFSKTVQGFQDATWSKVYMLLNFSLKIKTCKGNSKIHTGVTNFTHLFCWWVLSIWSLLISYSAKIPLLCRRGVNALSPRKRLLFSCWCLPLWGHGDGVMQISFLSVMPLPVLSLPLFLPACVQWSEDVDSYSSVQVLLDLCYSGTECFVWPLQEFGNFM